MAIVTLTTPITSTRKNLTRRGAKLASAASPAHLLENKEMHAEISERAGSSQDLNHMTTLDSTMTRDEIIAKVVRRK